MQQEEADTEALRGFGNVGVKEIAARLRTTCKHFQLRRVDEEFYVFICFGVKPSVAATEQSAENKSKRMFMEVLHETLTRQTQDTQQCLVTNREGI